MSEELLAIVPSDRAVEQALVSLKKGSHLLKYEHRGKPKFCPFRLSTDGKFLIWYSGQEEKQLRLCSTMTIIRGQKTTNFQRQLQPERESQSISIVYENGQQSLDLICKDKAQADSWCLGLRAVISKCHHSRFLGVPKSQRGEQSCISSPVSYMRRKRNLGIYEQTAKFSEAPRLCGSPTRSMSEKCFSDALSCSSNSFYSESSLSSVQNVMDTFIPKSPSVEPYDFKKRGTVTATQTDILHSEYKIHVQVSPQIDETVLRDILIWGEGMEGGHLGLGFDKFSTLNKTHTDALLPKLLESTMSLDVHKVSLGTNHAALVTKQGEVFCWGDGSRGRLGNKVDMDAAHPKIVESLSGFRVKSVVCGEYQTFALTFSGEVYTWGYNCYGADLIGENNKKSQWLPHRISGPLDGVTISQVACGDWHTAIVSTSGKLFTYGDGTFGVLGHGNLQIISQPKEIESLKGLAVRSVACGSWHTAAIVEIMVDRCQFNVWGGKLFTWGDGDKGKLGHASQERTLLPTCVTQLMDHDFIQVACGRMLTAALTNEGKVYTMGSAVHGQLGDPLAKDKSITIVQGKIKDEFVREISSGSYHISVLTSSGSVYTWGKGLNGQLGLGDTKDRHCPTLVEALRDKKVESVACGSSFTAAICLHKSISSSDQSICRGCTLAFGFTRKKHNCYNCGLLFCHVCSSKKATNADLAPNRSKQFRVCDPCFDNLTHLDIPQKLANHSPRLNLTTKKASLDESTERGESICTPRQLVLTRKFCKEISQSHGRKNVKSQGENHQLLDTVSFSAGLPRLGQVSCPSLFRNNDGENTMSLISVLKNQLPSTPVWSQWVPLRSNSPISSSMNEEKGLLESNKFLIEEIDKLRAEAANLEKLCQTRNKKIQECKHKIEETWSLAKEEASKSKAAKEFINVLKSKIRTMSEKLKADKELKDRVGAHLPQLTANAPDSPILKGVNKLLISTHFPSEVHNRNFDSLSSSPISFSNTVKSICNGDSYHGGHILGAEPTVDRTESRTNGSKPLKHEWVEKCEPGVYITFIALPNGQKVVKRVRFSRKKFTSKEAEKWWEANELAVYQKYKVEEYSS